MGYKLAVAGLLLLLISFNVIVWLLRRGRRLAKELRLRHPDLWEQWGRPMPTLTESRSRTEFNKVVGQRLYRETNDQDLIRAFEALRRDTYLTVIASVSLMGLVVAAAWWTGSL